MIYCITGGFILLDMVTGIIKALAKKEFTSSVMREGLFHKCGSLLCIVFGILADIAQTYVDLGVNIPVTIAICGYICLMEAGSIIENVTTINPDIMPSKLTALFSKLNGNKD